MLTKRIIMLLWVALACLVFFSSFEEQIVLNAKTKRTLNLIFPEGWGFFTKNPREPQLKVFQLIENDTVPIDMSNHSSKNYFGFSRKARLISYEASIIVNDVKKDKWTETTFGKIHSKSIDTIHIYEKKYFKHIKNGNYIFALFKPLPYAWANQKQEKHNPVNVVKIIINEQR